MLKDKFKSSIIYIFFILLLLSVITEGEVIFANYRGELEAVAFDFFQSGDINSAIVTLKDKENSFSEKKGYDYCVFRGEMELLIGEMKQVMNKEEAEEHFAVAKDFGQKALAEKETRLAKRIKYEGITRLFDYRSVFYILRNYRKAERLLEELLEEKSEDKMILFLEAAYYINAPGIAGGDQDKGKELFSMLKKLENPVFKFIAFNKLFKIYQKAGNEEKAEIYIQQAEEIFPESPLVGELF